MVLKLPCYGATMRQAARAISQEYDRVLAPLNLTTTQFTLLRTLDQRPGTRVNDLAEALAMDQTTASRTLALVKKAGLIKRQLGEERREVRMVVAGGRKEKPPKRTPVWEGAQPTRRPPPQAWEAARFKNAVFPPPEKLVG